MLPAGTALAPLLALPDGGAVTVLLDDVSFPPLSGILVRQGATVHAYLNRCPHAGRPLGIGSRSVLTPDGELLQCLAHGALFEKYTGLCIAGPCVSDTLRRLPVQVIDGDVQLSEPLDLEQLARSPW